MKTRWKNLRKKAGTTLVEVVVASSLGVMAAAGVTSVFLWCGRQAVLCMKINWSQNEAMRTSGKLTDYLRNAAEVIAVDEVGGCWVRLRFADGQIATLSYSNAVSQLRDGRMYLVRTNGTEVIVARGLTEVMDENGFTTPVFSSVRGNEVELSYRVSEPVQPADRDANDGPYAARVRFSVSTRNFERP